MDKLKDSDYKLVWKLSGQAIYKDIFGNQQFFYNWGEFTSEYNTGEPPQYNCLNEPTGTPLVYVNLEDARHHNLIEENAGKIQIKAKMLPSDQRLFKKPFASIRLHSTPSFTYGLFVYHITKIPDPKTYWSAAWLTAPFACKDGNIGSRNIFGGWPSSGEIDVMEYINGDDFSISSIHVPCRSRDDPIQISRNQNSKGPGYYALEWTPKYIKYYFVPEDDGKLLFTGKVLKMDDLKDYNQVESNRCDDGGCDVSKDDRAVNIEVNSDSYFVQEGGVPPCTLPDGVKTEFADKLMQKKEIVMYPIGNHAVKAGGMNLILNIAINAKCTDTTCEGVMEIAEVLVFQIPNPKK